MASDEARRPPIKEETKGSRHIVGISENMGHHNLQPKEQAAYQHPYVG